MSTSSTVTDQQYVCAGDLDLRALDRLTNVLNYPKVQKIDVAALMSHMSIEEVKEKLVLIIKKCAKETDAKTKSIERQRGLAAIALRSIDMPSHSTFLRSDVKPFRNFLQKKIL